MNSERFLIDTNIFILLFNNRLTEPLPDGENGSYAVLIHSRLMQRKTCQQDALPLTNEQRIELDRRLDAYERDNVKGREVSNVVTNLKKRL